MSNRRFNPPPGWPDPPAGWAPPANWSPDPDWPPAPPDWSFWVPADIEPSATNGSGLDPQANGRPGPIGTGRHAAPATGAPPGPPAPGPTGRHAAPAAAIPVITTVVPLSSRPAARRHGTRDHGALDHGALDHGTRDHGARDAEAPNRRIGEVERRIRALEQEEAELEGVLAELNGAVAVHDAGLDNYHHPLESAALYKPLLAELQARMTELIRLGRAMLASTSLVHENSPARGQKITSDFARLMLRAYNAEADSTLRSLRPGEVAAAVQRLENAAGTIARLGTAMGLRVAPDYHELRLEEIRLTADHLMKTQEQQDATRQERARLREEEAAQQQLAQEHARLDRERKRVLHALPLAEGQSKEADLRERLAQLDGAIERNDRQAGDLRAGYVYVASNLGAFGANVVKIGVTRMLDPVQRVGELGDESVPFPFDVHFVCFSDDAVTLARQLHEQFAARTVNHADPQRGFFFASPPEVRDALSALLGDEIDFVEAPDAIQYYQSRGRWPEELRG